MLSLLAFIPGVGPALTFVTTYWRFFVFLALLAVIGGLAFVWHERGVQIEENLATISAQNAEIGTLQANLKEAADKAAIQAQANEIASAKVQVEQDISSRVQTLAQEASHAIPKCAVDPVVSDAFAGIAKLRVETGGAVKPHH